jgi:hypothetical protein
MSRHLPVVSVLLAAVALTAPAAAAQPRGVCPRHLACGAIRADEAFGSYVYAHFAVPNPGAFIACQPVRHRRRHYHCMDRAARKGRLSTCVVRGTVVEVKPGTDDVRHAKATSSCPKRHKR